MANWRRRRPLLRLRGGRLCERHSSRVIFVCDLSLHDHDDDNDDQPFQSGCEKKVMNYLDYHTIQFRDRAKVARERASELCPLLSCYSLFLFRGHSLTCKPLEGQAAKRAASLAGLPKEKK